MGRQHGGQSLIEFALTIGAFLIVLFGALSTALYAVQRSAAVTAAAAGARAAASAQPANANLPDLPAAAPVVTSRMSAVLFGTTLTPLPAGQSCDALSAIPAGRLEVCSTRADADMVLVVVRGKPLDLVPFVPLPWTIDAEAEIHQVTFTR